MEISKEYKQTEFGLIPEDWVNCTFKDVLTTFSSGATPYRAISDYYKGNINWISSGELNYNKITETIEHISESAVKNTHLHIHQSGTFLMAITGLEAAGTRGRCAFVGVPATTNQSCLAINGTEKMCVNYLFWFYRMWGEYLAFKYCQGTKQQSYTAEIVKKLPIYCPRELAEQEKIAKALSDVDELIGALERKIEKKRLIKQGTMQQLLTGKKRLPGFSQPWIVKRLEQIGNTYTGLTGKSKDDFSCGSAKYITFVNVLNNPILKPELFEAVNVVTNEQQNQVVYGDLFFNTSSETPEEVGICSILLTSVKNLFLNSFCFGYRITDDTVWGLYLVYYFRSKEGRDLMQSLAQGSTRYNLSKENFNSSCIKVPKNKKEQQAIAQILTDMDKEIEDLEARCDKYKAIKSGMMQLLLTGKIRLVEENVSNTESIRMIPVEAQVIAGHIVYRLYNSRGFGRTKLQKSLHLLEYHCDLDLRTDFIRNVAGPDDQNLMNYIDGKFRQYQQVRVIKEHDKDGWVHYNYIPTARIEEVEMAYEMKYPQNIRRKIDELLDKLALMDLACSEIISTLYAVWNNRLIKHEVVTDDDLITDFYAWSAHKADFSRVRVENALNYMRENQLVPHGTGRYIDKK